MIVSTWNVNSLNVRLPQVLDWLAAQQQAAAPVDVLCLQELKLTDDKFPREAFEQLGWHMAYTGQKTYNGVAILSRQPLTDVVLNNPRYEDEQRRLVAATIDGVRIINGYFPNGQEVGSDKYAYKLAWLDALIELVREDLSRFPKLVLCGDFNIAPADADVHDPALWGEGLHVSPQERARFFRFIDELGLKDTFRLFEQAPKLFSWWDYRNLGFQKNQGLRIDHILASPALAAGCKRSWIDRQPRKNKQPSDHAPVLAEFSIT